MTKKPFEDPVLPPVDGSEIEAAIDISIKGSDLISRPVFIAQDSEILQLTLEDARRLLGFLQKAVPFLEEYRERTTM